MNRIFVTAIFCGLIFGQTGLVSAAIVVFRAANRDPIYGKVLDQNSARVTVRTVDARGHASERVIPAADIAEILETVASERLAKLDPSKPQEYLDYAEELSRKVRDEEARETAIRLSLIAAKLDPEHLERSAMLGLIPLARTASEEKAFRAAAHLAGHLPEATSLAVAVKSSSQAEDQAGANDLLRAVRAIRRGRGNDARTILDQSSGAATVLARYRRIFSQEELLSACSAVDMKPELLHKCLMLELALETGAIETRLAHMGASWSAELQGDGAAPVPCFKLDCLTEFDPRASIYHEGKWIVPSGQ